jgi:Plavaka transposase
VLAKAGESWPKYRLAPLLTHCKRELYHASWNILLDDAFMEAYEHGIVVTWMDGLERRFYPRIFTYSADYPEKYVLLLWDEGAI